MQLGGDRLTQETAAFGNDLSTLPNYSAGIQAPAGTPGRRPHPLFALAAWGFTRRWTRSGSIWVCHGGSWHARWE
jgi:hypothetical protein